MSLIWHQFFSTKDLDDNSVQFNLDTLTRMGHEERKEVFSFFFIRFTISIIKRMVYPIKTCTTQVY